VSKDSDQTQTAPRKFKLGPLGNLNQVTKGLAKTIRAMADGSLDSQVGARICNGLGILRACLETRRLEHAVVPQKSGGIKVRWEIVHVHADELPAPETIEGEYEQLPKGNGGNGHS
jgi:hypothetical protein